MRLNGVWVGWGLGDNSSVDFTVKDIKRYMRAMFHSYAGNLADTNLFDQQMFDVVVTMQEKLVARPMNSVHLVPGQFIRGVLDLPTQQAMGYKKPKVVQPVIFTVEGHASNMWFGPCASNAEYLQKHDKVCYWQPVGYDVNSMPFKNADGVNQLLVLVGSTMLPDGTPFPAGTNWGIEGFSQGAMIVSEFMAKHVLPQNGLLHWRLKDFKRGLALGNPRREFGKMCWWNDNPPPEDTQGIMGDMTGKGTFVTTGTAIEDLWQENSNDGDMFGVNKRTSAGMDKTAIAKIVTENSWIGGEAAIAARAMNIITNPLAGGFAAAMAIIEAIMFLAKNPNPHYATVAEPGDVDWMRGVAA